ncbi:hypothetical protein BLNAU_6924 [Blattamonas nauphoetae]|uniref:Uncharacterized protein n=1 Tax=Blattamonas nauphoetae TaxID=2049346 RepID=A0ABQ9Y2S8_9EUKA|nr:hypothetical protein BLNAU_6924 [Blattamonas nauphoetae]
MVSDAEDSYRQIAAPPKPPPTAAVISLNEQRVYETDVRGEEEVIENLSFWTNSVNDSDFSVSEFSSRIHEKNEVFTHLKLPPKFTSNIPVPLSWFELKQIELPTIR